jgi:hypothetical protein
MIYCHKVLTTMLFRFKVLRFNYISYIDNGNGINSNRICYITRRYESLTKLNTPFWFRSEVDLFIIHST